MSNVRELTVLQSKNLLTSEQRTELQELLSSLGIQQVLKQATLRSNVLQE